MVIGVRLMKVYILMNTYEDEIEGVFTYEGKVAKDKERLEAAHILRVKDIEQLGKERAKFAKAVDGLNKQIQYAFSDISTSPSNILNTIAKRDMAVAKYKQLQARINDINQLSAEEVINKYGTTYWEVRELRGD